MKMNAIACRVDAEQRASLTCRRPRLLNIHIYYEEISTSFDLDLPDLSVGIILSPLQVLD